MSAQPFPGICDFAAFDEAPDITNDQWTATTNASIAPTKQEQEAILLLKDQHAAIVCAYLRVARALGGGCRLDNGQSVLTDDELRAIFALSGHKDAIVWSWLSDAQGAIEHNHSEKLMSRVNIAHNSLHEENKPHTTISLSTGFPGLPIHESTDIPPLYGKFIANRQPTTRHYTQSYPSNQPVPADAVNFSRPYSCTICGSQRSYQNHYDWKKHEKEHEATYICMIGNLQNGAITDEKTETRRACKFSCKRRDHMVTHLNRRHEVHNVTQARLFANQWRCNSGKMFWSCGFCIRLFTGFGQRLKHIGSEHYERNQTYDEWDTTKLIRGLLLQPEVQRAWDSILATCPTNHLEKLVWDARTIEKTQYLLEMGPSSTQSAESLAMAVYEAGKLKTEPPQPASALSITTAVGDAVETHFGNSDITINAPVSRHASVEHMLTHLASSNTSVANANSANWTASTGHTFDELFHEVEPSEDQIHMPDGTPSSYYDNSGLASGFEYSHAPY